MATAYLLAVACISGIAKAAPYLGGHVYQPVVDPYLYVTPSPLIYQPYQQTYHQPYQQLYRIGYNQPELITNQQLINHVAHEYYQEATGPEEDLAEINQFHSEDAEGRVLYGFHGHNQARMEARDPKGRVRGSYSYVDPHGQVVRMDYWDDGSGFQARGHNVPKQIYDFPSFTPEVQAARDHHLKLYQQILLSTIQAQHHNKIPVDDYPYIERPDGAAVSAPTGQNDEDDTVEVGAPTSPDNTDAYPGSMRVPQPPTTLFQQPAFPFQNENDEDLESIALDNPELQDFGRDAKSLSTKDSKQDGSVQQDQVKNLEKETKDLTKKTDKKTEKDKNNAKIVKLSEESTKKEEKTNDENTHHNGFAYNFQYTVGEPSKHQELPKFEKVSSVAASEPVPKDKKTSLHSVHPLPLGTMTSMGDSDSPNHNIEPEPHHDLQVSPYQSLLQRPIIIRTFSSPLLTNNNQPRLKTNSKTEKSKTN